MFVDFPEIVIIFGIALVVLGPKKLPGTAAQIGRWVGRARAMARQFREQLEQEVNSVESSLDIERSHEPTIRNPASSSPTAQGSPPAAVATGGSGGPQHATELAAQRAAALAAQPPGVAPHAANAQSDFAAGMAATGAPWPPDPASAAHDAQSSHADPPDPARESPASPSTQSHPPRWSDNHGDEAATHHASDVEHH
ncbi:MAG TPA: twin-arginine translocase TatA/TatE family subunit [Steroidobacteraceae bacterium]|nr:twin-arginine translocase TatA/TatE family subunit [Steroidobacteraceae bacterium]